MQESYSDLPPENLSNPRSPNATQNYQRHIILLWLQLGNIDHEKYRKSIEYSIDVEYPIYVTNIEYRTIPLSLHGFLDTNQVYQNLIIPLWLWHGLGYQAVFKSTPKSLKMLTKHHNNDNR